VAAAGEFAIVLGDRIPVAGGNFGRVGVADCAAVVSIELAAQLQFQRVHAADELLVHLLDQGGITGETARIQTAHLVDQGLQLLPRLGTILHHGPNLVEKVQSLVNLALGIGGVGTLLRGYGPPSDASIAGVITAIRATTAIGATSRIAYLTRDAVANLATLTGLAALPLLLTWSAGLAGGLAAGLTGAAGLALSWLRVGLSVGASTKSSQLVAQTG
jgi:hypothetical protein